jgi:hypothetical protein
MLNTLPVLLVAKPGYCGVVRGGAGPPCVPGAAGTRGAPAAGAASLVCSPADAGCGACGEGPPWVPGLAVTPGAPAAVAPSLACSPTDPAGLAGFCFWMAVLGCTALPAAGPDVVPCCATAVDPRVSSAANAAPDAQRLMLISELSPMWKSPPISSRPSGHIFSSQPRLTYQRWLRGRRLRL